MTKDLETSCQKGGKKWAKSQHKSEDYLSSSRLQKLAIFFSKSRFFFSRKKQGIGIFSECKNAVENEKLFKIWILTKHMSGETEMKKKDPKPY